MYSTLHAFSTPCVRLGLWNEKSRLWQCIRGHAAAFWCHHYAIISSRASCSNDFCDEGKKANLTLAHLSLFFQIPLQENSSLSLQFIQLQIYSSAKSTIWYSPSLFFSLWSKSNHSKWLLMVIIATAPYWSRGCMEWKAHSEKGKVLLVGSTVWFVYLALVKI